MVNWAVITVHGAVAELELNTDSVMNALEKPYYPSRIWFELPSNCRYDGNVAFIAIRDCMNSGKRARSPVTDLDLKWKTWRTQ